MPKLEDYKIVRMIAFVAIIGTAWFIGGVIENSIIFGRDDNTFRWGAMVSIDLFLILVLSDILRDYKKELKEYGEHL